MTETRFEAIVIGGGPAGATTALLLARRGWRVAVVEKSTFPRRKVCGEFISATNIGLLDTLGIGEGWRAQAGPEVQRVGFYCGGTIVDAPMPGARRGRFGRALGRDLLDTMLLEQAVLAGAEVFQPWRAVGIEPQGDRKVVRIDNRRGELSIGAPVIVAAHGSWEPGKLPSQLDKANRPDDLLGFKAHFRHGALPSDLMPLIVFPGGYGGMVWSDHGRLSISCCVRRDVLAEARKRYGNISAAEALRRHMMKSCLGVQEAIGDATPDGHWLAAGPIRPGVRTGYRDDIFRVGNIAGESHPIIAEGITMAIQSGWLLAAALSEIDPQDAGARVAAGGRYRRAWRQLFALRVCAAAAFAAIALSSAGRAQMRTLIQAAPSLLKIGAALSGKTRAVPGLPRGTAANFRYDCDPVEPPPPAFGGG
jgi:menaquinone-9 beta-reductase